MTEIPDFLLKRSQERRAALGFDSSSTRPPIPEQLLERAAAARSRARDTTDDGEYDSSSTTSVGRRLLSGSERSIFDSIETELGSGRSLFGGANRSIFTEDTSNDPDLEAIDNLTGAIEGLTTVFERLVGEGVESGRVALSGSVTLDFNGDLPQVNFDNFAVEYSATTE